MRVSPCGLAAVHLKEAIALAEVSAEVTHNHPEGIKGAKCVVAAVFLAKTGRLKEEIRQYSHFFEAAEEKNGEIIAEIYGAK